MDKTQLTYLAAALDKGLFLRDILYERLLLSHSLVVKLKHLNKIKVNALPARTNCPIYEGDYITIDMDFTEENMIIAECLPLDIVYEDEDFLVVNKPAGMSTHPSQLGGIGSLANAVTYYWQKQGINTLFRPINRLDRDTSGLVLIGKSQYAHQAVFKGKKGGIIERRYLALVEGTMPQDNGRIDLPIGQLDDKKRRRIVRTDGRPAVTNYKVIAKYPGHSLLSLKLETGRTHQIRVHLSFLGCPVCGDLLYGFASSFVDRQALHADRLRFIHPRNGKEVVIDIPLAPDIEKAVYRLANQP